MKSARSSSPSRSTSSLSNRSPTRGHGDEARRLAPPPARGAGEGHLIGGGSPEAPRLFDVIYYPQLVPAWVVRGWVAPTPPMERIAVASAVLMLVALWVVRVVRRYSAMLEALQQQRARQDPQT
jgi:hypothetical protein